MAVDSVLSVLWVWLVAVDSVLLGVLALLGAEGGEHWNKKKQRYSC